MRVVSLIAVLCALTNVALAAPPKKVRIGVAIDGPSPQGEQLYGVFREEIVSLLKGEFEVDMLDAKRVVGDWTLESARAGVDRLLADPEVDVVLAIGLVCSSELARKPVLPKPSLAVWIIDTTLQGVPFDNGTSGKKNLTYVTTPDTLKRDLELYRALVPFQKLAILAAKSMLDAVPGIALAAKAQAAASGIDIEIVPVAASADEALAAIPKDVQAVYYTPVIQLPEAEQDKLIAGLTARKLPSFSLWGRSDVERGIMATALARPDYSRRARRIALDIQRILLGDEAAKLPVLLSREEGLVINMTTARAIGFSPSWSALTEAELIDQGRTDIDRKLSLRSAVEEAIARNLDLAANAESLAAAKQDARRALSPLLPQISANAVGSMIDADRAAASFGSAPERSVSVGGRATQLIFAEQAWANLDIQDHIYSAREAARESLKLDVVQDAASSYLNVLRSRSLERVRRENLRKTKSNLELARVRTAAGAAGKSELLRWEAQLSNERRSVIESSAQRNAAEIALNRVLGHPLEEPFVVEDISLENPELFLSRSRIADSLQNPASFRVYREFIVSEGLATSWELKQLDRVIAAQERALTSAKLAFWLPTLALQADLSQRVIEGGDGTSGPALPPMFAELLPSTDETTWSIAVVATLPLFLGNSRYADLEKAEHELAQRTMERRAVAERLEGGIRAALHVVGASYPAIALSKEASRAARENLEIVTDAYSKGAVQIIVLLDAQNAALLAEEAAANATYSFLLDHVRAQRAAGWYDFIATPEEASAWLQRFNAYRGGDSAP